MSIPCLDNLIGIRGECESTSPLSGLYIDDLQYIDIINANDTVGVGGKSGNDLLQKSINRAQGYLFNDIHQKLQPKFQYSSVLNNDTIGFIDENYTTVSGSSNTLKGIEIEIDEYPHLEVFISNISLFITTATTVNILIYDLIDGSLIATNPITTVANTVTTKDIYVKIPNRRQKQRLFIGYNSTGITSYKTNIHQNSKGCNTCGGAYYRNVWSLFKAKKIATSDAKVVPNLQNANDTGGLSFNYSLNCSISNFLCGIRDSLAYPLLYRAGMEFLYEILATKRYNSTTIKTDTIKEFQAYFEEQYMQSLDNVLYNLRLPNDICFQCQSKINIGTSIP